ncbi:MAG: NAD(P)/FAD-dependent oxidoreductase [Humidesulfovibrio sp.]|uniref:NAD(P)/FAD-dependent oxidoreductase n=1 Tax=Humidesulfovibrio sp. TaxID=2910988 RepID=UPI002735266F|nr:NAD(P)/FAD-dependent oxidoreductase [Humidesulfovibrio sp.]MDP2849160.1 NAD(P)/FAD-dependent oxidoreductase [Humidesulfovibrio sp.]
MRPIATNNPVSAPAEDVCPLVETCRVVPHLPSGVVTASQLEALAQALRRYAIPFAKLTTGQRIALMGVRGEDLPDLLSDLGAAGLGVEPEASHGGGFVQACPGSVGCKNGTQDTIAMGLRVEALLVGLAALGLTLPAKVRVGVSGCPRCCAESYVRDVGLVGRKDGWTVIFGGNAGAKPRAGDELASGLHADAALDLVRRLLEHYGAGARKHQRTARFVEAAGIGSVREALGLNYNHA